MKSFVSIHRLTKVATLIALSLVLSACDENSPTENNSQSTASAIHLDVYKSESCGCCGIWVEHMEGNNFATAIHHPQDLNAVKLEHSIDPQWQSCHTAVSKEGYVFEGHVPAKFVQQFLDQPPADAIGLAVPGMPLGSPGMEVGDRFTPYKIQLLKKDGSTEIYADIASLEDQF